MQGKESHTEWGSGDLLSLLIATKKQDGTPAFSPAEVHDEVRPSETLNAFSHPEDARTPCDPAQLGG